MPRTKRMGHVRYGWQALGTIKCVKKKKKKMRLNILRSIRTKVNIRAERKYI